VVKCKDHWCILHASARSVLPMGVAPEAIDGLYLFEYRLKVSLSLIVIFALHKKFPLCDFSIGCATSAPDGSSPRDCDGVLAADYRLKSNFLWLSPQLVFSLLLEIMNSLMTRRTSSHISHFDRINNVSTWIIMTYMRDHSYTLIWLDADRHMWAAW
jgi:hypothetical protein